VSTSDYEYLFDIGPASAANNAGIAEELARQFEERVDAYKEKFQVIFFGTDDREITNMAIDSAHMEFLMSGKLDLLMAQDLGPVLSA